MTRQDGNGTGSAFWQAVLAMLRAVLRSRTTPSRTTPSRTTKRPPSGGTARQTRSPHRAPARTRRPGTTAAKPAAGPGGSRDGYAGDATTVPALRYEPYPDDDADPGEIVWAWVPYEEDHSRGKDRPVLVVGRRNGLLLALMLSSQDHDADRPDEARFGRRWVDIGSGAWDPQRRPSEVRVDRVLQLDPAAVRRPGATLDRPRFERVAAAVRDTHPPR